MRLVPRNEQDRKQVRIQTMTQTGEKIRLARKARRMSQDDLADILGTDRETISKYENGVHEMGITTFIQIARALEMNPAELLPEDPEDRRKQNGRDRLNEIAGKLSERDLELVLGLAESMIRNQK